jgi:hypothetical protein
MLVNNTRNKSLLTLPVTLLLAMLAADAGADSDPLYTSNQNPLVMSYGIPAPESARILTAGAYSTGMFLAVSSIAINEHNAEETIVLDGESYSLSFRLRYGWNDRLQLGMDIAAIRHEGGSLDGIVESWHDLFGQPNGSRDFQPDDRLLFSYNHQDNRDHLVLDDAQSGIGDLRLSAIYQMQNTDRYQTAIRGGLKLPVGDADKLTGSGSTDLSIELLGSLLPDVESNSLQLHSSLGVLYTGDGDVLGNIKKDWVPFGHASLAWAVSPRIQLKVQLNGQGSMYNSQLSTLRDASIELIVGGTATLSSHWVMDISFTEDIVGRSSPDFTVLVGLRYHM